MFISPTVVGEAVIIGSCSGSLYSLDRTTGEPIWLYDTAADGPRAQFHGEPILLGDGLVVPTDSNPKGHLYSFDIASGKLLWKVPFNYGVGTTPLLIGERIVVVSVEGDVAAIDSKSGKIAWRVTPVGTLEPGLAIPSPAYAANRILVVDNANQIVALDAADGTTVWRKTLSGRPNTSLLVTGNDVVVGTADGQPLAHDSRSDDGGDEQCGSDSFADNGAHVAPDIRMSEYSYATIIVAGCHHAPPRSPSAISSRPSPIRRGFASSICCAKGSDASAIS